MAKKFAVFDIDGTLIRWQLYHSLVDQLAKQGNISSDDHERIKNRRMTWKKRAHSQTFKEYQSELINVFHSSIVNIPTADFDRAVETVFTEYKDQVYTYTRDLIKTLRERGYILFAISGSHHELITKLAKHYGFDDAIGNTYERKNGKFTGQHQYVAENKPLLLEKLVKKYKVSWQGSIGIGDSASDAAILEAVEQPIAFNPDQGLFEIATQNGWQVVIERKNMVYELEPKNGTYVLAKAN